MKTNYLFKICRLIQAAALSAGLALASSAFATEHSYIIDLNSKKVTELGSLGGDSTHATGINDSGQVVGDSATATGVSHAFITGPNGIGITDLGPPDGFARINAAGQVVGYTGGGNAFGPPDSFARGINAAGQVVGYTGAGHAFITGPNGVGMTDLGTLGGRYSFANDINAAGQVTGYAETAGDGGHAFITGPNGVGMIDLGTLGEPRSYGWAINDVGQVAGFSATHESSSHAFITGANGAGMTDLNSLVSLPDGVVLTEATAINNMGQVVAIGSIPAVPIPAIPEPDSYALMIAGLGLVGFMARRRKAGGVERRAALPDNLTGKQMEGIV